MRRGKLTDMRGGWWGGNFIPSFFKSPHVEVAYKRHKKGETWPAHFQNKATEYNLLIKGKLKDGGQFFEAGDLWEVKPGELSSPEFLSDCEVMCVKLPSLPNDKVLK